jgi:hypothetical protein
MKFELGVTALNFPRLDPPRLGAACRLVLTIPLGLDPVDERTESRTHTHATTPFN